MPPKKRQKKSEQASQATKTGIVFVHGIGTQPPRETFLDWATPIVRILSELRQEIDATPTASPPVGEEPVWQARTESDDRVWAEVKIPAACDRPAGTWLITESYWAGQIRAPGLGTTIGYLRQRLVPIIRGIARGYGVREPRRKARIARMIDDQPRPWTEETYPLVWDLQKAVSWRWMWIDWLDRVWQYAPVRWLLSVVAAGATVGALTVYAPLRSFPIKAVRDWAERASLDTWLVDWFGDLPVLLDDHIQAAFVRDRLEETIRWLEEQDCDQIVVIAHSGGAIVSYETLLAMREKKFRVTKLITHGQGLALGWRLKLAGGQIPVGNPLRGDLGARHPKLRWVDFWASYDPAPAGQLAAVDGCPLVSDPSPPPPTGSPIHVESRPVTNFMHMGEDHGGYWSNDEGFLVPLIRHIDDPAGDGTGSRFYQDKIARAVRIERRRRRVGILLGWRWLTFAAGLLALIAAAASPTGLAAAGNAVAAVWSLLPLNQVVSAPVDGVGKVVAIVLEGIHLEPVADAIAGLGPLLLGAIIPVVGAFLIYSRGVESWRAADEVERQKIRRELLDYPGEAWARSEAGLLVGGLIALVIAAILPLLGVSFADSLEIMAIVLGATAVVAVILRGT